MELKKSLGQHFLVDEGVLSDIVEVIKKSCFKDHIVEIGPGMGALTQYILPIAPGKYMAIEMDDRFVVELPKKFSKLNDHIIHNDVLKVDFTKLPFDSFALIGNFPYNISNQIVFKIIENSSLIHHSVGMFQKEVAKRIASSHGSKEYGVLSVLAQVLYDIVYHFDIPPTAFNPPPKVVSGIISMTRRELPLTLKFKELKIVVKAAFNQRRKTLNNSLKGMKFEDQVLFESIKGLRPEQLSVSQFCVLAENLILH
jgi:16S rRNA (adenine1518-N6/adenine1519-N6)-dimethyltransferase